jgi:hypothetical protein
VSAAQGGVGRLALGRSRVVAREAVAQLAEGEAAAPRRPRPSAHPVGVIAEDRRPSARASGGGLGVGRERAARAIERRLVADAVDHVGEGLLRGPGVEGAGRREHRGPELPREPLGDLGAARVEPVEPAVRGDVDTPREGLERASPALAPRTGRSPAGEQRLVGRDDQLETEGHLGERREAQARGALVVALVRDRQQATEAAIAVMIADQQEDRARGASRRRSVVLDRELRAADELASSLLHLAVRADEPVDAVAIGDADRR